jgi:hypothetical protein
MSRAASDVVLTREGRRILAIVYCVLGLATVIVYWIWRDPVYAIGQAVVLAAGILWVRWCLRRAAPG